MTSDASTNSVMAFLGVPYAQPPVGDLRFALPQPVSPWEGIRDAIEHCKCFYSITLCIGIVREICLHHVNFPNSCADFYYYNSQCQY